MGETERTCAGGQLRHLAPSNRRPQRTWISVGLLRPHCYPPCLAASERQRKQLLGPRDEVPGQRSSILWGGISREPSCVLIINFCLSSGHRCGISCLSLLTLPWKVSGSSPAVSLGYLSWHRSWIHKPGAFLLWDASQGGWPGRGLCGAVGEVTRLPP